MDDNDASNLVKKLGHVQLRLRQWATKMVPSSFSGENPQATAIQALEGSKKL